MKTEPYQSNVLPELKREALVKKDIEVLRKIKEYENDDYENIFFMHENIPQIYDREGNMVSIDNIVSDWRTEVTLIDIDIIRTVAQQERTPGSLIREIERFNENRYNCSSIMIYELPANTPLPLPEGYDWGRDCLMQPVAVPDDTVLELIGEKLTFYIYWDNLGYKTLSKYKPTKPFRVA